MSLSLTLMRTELRLLLRNTTAWTTAIAIPIVLGALWAVGEPPLGESWGGIVVLQVMMLLSFTLHTVGAMTLASRREQLVLKRWRASQASPTAVLTGSVGMLAGLVVAQTVALTWMTIAVSDQRPQSVAMLGLGVLAGVVTVGALTFVVAAFTRSAEHAMITTFPVIMALLGAAGWGLTRPLEAWDAAVLAIPGGSAVQLLRLGWEGPPVGQHLGAWLAAAGPSLGVTLLVAGVATAAAVRWFRWDPR